MTNFNKHGYSTTEVAQIFGCTVSTIHNMINRHVLGAMVTGSSNPNGRKTIRISRENIQEFIRSNPDRFTDADRKAWKIDEDKEEQSLSTIMNKPTGAWRDLFEAEKKDLGINHADVTEVENESLLDESAKPIKIPQYSVMVNGRIAVSGIAKDTAIAIATALINDTGSAEFNDVTIKIDR
jgi:transposase